VEKRPRCVLAHRLNWLLSLAAAGLALLFFSPPVWGTDLELPVLGLLMLSVTGTCLARVSVVCPHCGKPLYRGFHSSIFLPRRCPFCGEAILEKDDD